MQTYLKKTTPRKTKLINYYKLLISSRLMIRSLLMKTNLIKINKCNHSNPYTDIMVR